MKRNTVLVIHLSAEGKVATHMVSVSADFKNDHIGNGREFTGLDYETEQLAKKLNLNYDNDCDNLVVIPYPQNHQRIIVFDIEQSETNS